MSNTGNGEYPPSNQNGGQNDYGENPQSWQNTPPVQPGNQTPSAQYPPAQPPHDGNHQPTAQTPYSQQPSPDQQPTVAFNQPGQQGGANPYGATSQYGAQHPGGPQAPGGNQNPYGAPGQFNGAPPYGNGPGQGFGPDAGGPKKRLSTGALIGIIAAGLVVVLALVFGGIAIVNGLSGGNETVVAETETPAPSTPAPSESETTSPEPSEDVESTPSASAEPSNSPSADGDTATTPGAFVDFNVSLGGTQPGFSSEAHTGSDFELGPDNDFPVGPEIHLIDPNSTCYIRGYQGVDPTLNKGDDLESSVELMKVLSGVTSGEFTTTEETLASGSGGEVAFLLAEFTSGDATYTAYTRYFTEGEYWMYLSAECPDADNDATVKLAEWKDLFSVHFLNV
ncbi:hypothetical protein [Humidisolicoccus flavus]|uniref:hypothetical protein n=1 Tax=Humidisolicoccus flavus TaxID=3111414 RepID=UPI003244291E